jgi:hypothetical protein
LCVGYRQQDCCHVGAAVRQGRVRGRQPEHRGQEVVPGECLFQRRSCLVCHEHEPIASHLFGFATVTSCFAKRCRSFSQFTSDVVGESLDECAWQQDQSRHVDPL